MKAITERRPPESLIEYNDSICVIKENLDLVSQVESMRVKTEALREMMGKKIAMPNLDSKPTTEEILNAILPP
jgi:hypothetical protein